MIYCEIDCVTGSAEVAAAVCDPSPSPHHALQTSHRETVDIPFRHVREKELRGTRNADDRATTEDTADLGGLPDVQLKNQQTKRSLEQRIYKSSSVIVQEIKLPHRKYITGQCQWQGRRTTVINIDVYVINRH